MQATTYLEKEFAEHMVRHVCVRDVTIALGRRVERRSLNVEFVAADIGTDQTIRWGVLKSKVVPPPAKVCPACYSVQADTCQNVSIASDNLLCSVLFLCVSGNLRHK